MFRYPNFRNGNNPGGQVSGAGSTITSDHTAHWAIAHLHLKRSPNRSPQPYPNSGCGHIDGGRSIRRIFDLIHVPDSHHDLLLAFLVASFIPGIPHPVLILHGPQGSGKTFAFRTIRKIVDPSSLSALSLQGEHRELIQMLSHHWMAFFDNIRTLKDWQSDVLCRAVTGEGVSKRELYSDDDDIIYSFKRVVGLNGINVAATQPDLLDRSILVELERISSTDRRTERELEEAVSNAIPEIVGGVFDTLAKAMKIEPRLKMKTVPRMADFNRWGVAIMAALDPAIDFQSLYQENIAEQSAQVLESIPVATAICSLLEDEDWWTGSASDLLKRLQAVAIDKGIDSEDETWPKGAQALGRRLRQIQPNLLEMGVEYRSRRRSSGRIFVLERVDGKKVPSRNVKIKKGKKRTRRVKKVRKSTLD